MPSSMQSPVLDRIVVLIQPLKTDTRDAWNLPKYVDIEHEVWASRKDVSVSETVSTRIIVSNTKTLFTVRYRDDINNEWRIREGNQTFGIDGLKQVGRRRYLEIESKSNQV